jgi:hypothetical protein
MIADLDADLRRCVDALGEEGYPALKEMIAYHL